MSDNSKLVALTGVSGFIAGNITQLLLNKGYTVNGTVRSLKNKEKVSHLMALAETPEAKKAGGKLNLFEADLLKSGSFEKAFKGVSCVFHTASPFFFNVKDGEEEVIKPAIQGTTNALTEAFKAKTVKRVVLTSSMAAVGSSQYALDFVINDKCWNNTTKKNFYSYSKTWAEKKGWELIKQFQEKGSKMDLVTINPTLVLGAPKSARGDSFSVNYVLNQINGKVKERKDDSSSFIDVRDVAKAHVAAWENKKASGRYLLTTSVQNYRSDITSILKKHYGKNFDVTKITGERPKQRKTDNSRTIELIGKLTPLEDTVVNCVEGLIKFGFIKKKE